MAGVKGLGLGFPKELCEEESPLLDAAFAEKVRARTALRGTGFRARCMSSWGGALLSTEGAKLTRAKCVLCARWQAFRG